MLKKSIKFPLVMQSGVKVRTIEELRDNFDLGSVIELFLDGRLKTWLEQRFYRKELEQLESIMDIPIEEAEVIAEKLFEVFNVPFSKDSLDVSRIIKSRQKIGMLKQFTNDELINVEQVVTSQDELNELLMHNKSDVEKPVYLLGDAFEVSDEYSNVHYIGLNNPKVTLLSFGIFNAKEKGISFTDLTLISDKNVKVEEVKKDNENQEEVKAEVKEKSSEKSSILTNIININHLSYFPICESENEDTDVDEPKAEEVEEDYSSKPNWYKMLYSNK
jgi:hypothetical protein